MENRGFSFGHYIVNYIHCFAFLGGKKHGKSSKGVYKPRNPTTRDFYPVRDCGNENKKMFGKTEKLVKPFPISNMVK